MTLQELTEDINYLFEKLPEVHKDFFKLITKDDYQQVKENLRANLSENLTKSQFEFFLMPFFSILKDAHTNVETSVRKLPIVFEWLNGGYYALVVPEDSGTVLGQKLLSINGCTIDNFSIKAADYIISNNIEVERVSITYILINYDLVKHITNSSEPQIHYEFENDRHMYLTYDENIENIRQISLARYFKVSLPLYFFKTNYEVRNINDSLYLRYSKCRVDHAYPLEELITQIQKLLETNPTRIIIDLRNNMGGNSSLFDPILKLFKNYCAEHSVKVYGLINRKVFSSGAINTYDIKNGLQGILVGQPTSQGGNHFGDIKSFDLPNSKITICYSTKYFTYGDSNETTIQPDILIEPTIQELIDGKDSVLEYVLSN